MKNFIKLFIAIIAISFFSCDDNKSQLKKNVVEKTTTKTKRCVLNHTQNIDCYIAIKQKSSIIYFEQCKLFKEILEQQKITGKPVIFNEKLKKYVWLSLDIKRKRVIYH